MGALAVMSVFDIADDRHEFLEYLRYLHEQGLRPTRDAWLKEAAERLMGLDHPEVKAPTYVDQAWTLERRRLLVVLTWPYAHGDWAPRFPFADDADGFGGGVQGVYGRSYRELWQDVRTNLRSLVWLAEWRGSWDTLAKRWDLVGDVLWESARLGLVVTHHGERVGVDEVDAMKADRYAQDGIARDGFVLTWWNIVAAGECVGFSFEPFVRPEGSAGRTNWAAGEYTWDRESLVERLGKAALVDRFRTDAVARIEADVEAMASKELAPHELHRRITADGRIVPPASGAKYRALFAHLDSVDFVGKQATVSLRREELDELTTRAETEAPRALRGARGGPGLPKIALTSAQWWYGPSWNPDEADRDAAWAAVEDSAWVGAMGKKSQARAWMAAGLRAKPIFKNGTLVEVRFEPVKGREYWWPWRDALRDGSFSEKVVAD